MKGQSVRYTREQIIECLKAADCDDKCIEKYLNLSDQGEKFQCEQLLRKHRKDILERIHQEQRYIDVLDYFTYSLTEGV